MLSAKELIRLPLYYMLNKPAGLITACRDSNRPTVMECFKGELAARLHPIGRLDIDTHGLLLFTDDGKADFALMQPSHHAEKSYFFRAIGSLTPSDIDELENGMDIGGIFTAKARLTNVEKFTVADIKDFLPERRRAKYLKNANGEAFSAVLTIHEGKNHQVKRMLAHCRCKIVYLQRISVAGIELDGALSEGEYRELTAAERAKIERYIELYRGENDGTNSK